LQDQAAGILRDNAKYAVLPSGEFCWPNCVTWQAKPDLSIDAREALLQALVSMVHLQRVEWDRESLASLFINLYVMIDDKDPSIRAGALHGAAAVLDVLEEQYDMTELGLPTGFESGDRIRENLEGRIERLDPDQPATDKVLEHIHRINNRWGSPKEDEPEE
jgi:hypothetical protein